MQLLGSSLGPGRLVVLSASILGLSHAADFRRLDGIHRIEKDEARVTAAPAAGMERLERRDESVCGTGLNPCPSSLGGGCCSDGYECASESCFATTRAPSTCGTNVGWYPCASQFGGGCCPDGYRCQTADNCVPPAGVSYTYTCSAGSYLCPAELSYGCCPDGMGCGLNQCFPTEPSTSTIVSVRTTTRDGEVERITTTITSLIPARTPTSIPDPNDDGYDSHVIKYFPPEMAKISPTVSPDEDDDEDGGGGGGGLSTGALAGIVIGAVAFISVIVVAAFIIIRLNKVAAAVSGTKKSAASGPPVMMDRQLAGDDEDDDTSGYIRQRGPQRGYGKPTDSDIDAFSVDPSIVTPQLGDGSSHNNGPPTMTTDMTATSFGGNYQAVSTSHSNHMPGYFDSVAAMVAATAAPAPPRQSSVGPSPSNAAAANMVGGDSQGTTTRQPSTHARQWSDVSDESSGNGMTVAPYNPQPAPARELHGRSIVPELYGSVSPTSEFSPLEEARRRSASSSNLGWYGGGNPPAAGNGTGTGTIHQRARNGNGSGGTSVGAGRTGEIRGLGIVHEIHGFYGPSDGVVGATRDDTDVSEAQGKEKW